LIPPGSLTTATSPKRRIAYAGTGVGSTWYKTYLSDVSIRSDGIVRAQLNINSGGQQHHVNGWSFTILKCALCAPGLLHHDQCRADRHLYWFDFNIKEVAGYVIPGKTGSTM
jgi:hypothetical protein